MASSPCQRGAAPQHYGVTCALLLALALPAGAYETPGTGLRRLVERRFVAADLLEPVETAKWEEAAAAWPVTDSAWAPARAQAQGLRALREGLVGDDEEAVADGAERLGSALGLPPAGVAALVSRYAALRASLTAARTSIEPETGRLRRPDGAPVYPSDWKAHLESVPLGVRKSLMASFGAAAGLAAEPPKDPLLAAAKPPAPPKARAAPKPKPAAAPPKPVRKAPAPEPKVRSAGPKSDAMAKSIKALRGALDAPALAALLKEADKEAVLSCWERALSGAAGEDGAVDHSKAVNAMRELCAPPAPAGRWAATAAATYNLGSELGPKAALAAAFAQKGVALGAERLISSAMALTGAGPKPKDQPAFGAAFNQAMALDTAAAGWAGALPNAKKANPVDGTVKTFKLEGAVKSLKGMFGF